MGEVDTPRTIFHFIKRSNRTAKGKQSNENMKFEKFNSEALKILNMADVSTAIRTPSTMSSMAHHVLNCMETDANECEFNSEEAAIVERAMNRLRGFEPEEDEEHVDGELDENIFE